MMTRFRPLAATALVIGLASAAGAQQQQDFSAVQIKATKLADNFYTLEGQGGMIGALVGPDGVFMVDSQFAPLTEKIVAAIKQISDRPIKFLVNTHQHPDHTGGNENFAKLGVTVISRDELRGRLAATTGRGAVPPAALPMLTYKGAITLHMNGEEVQLIPVPAAHTDGDTMIHFVKANVLMPGDFYRSVGYTRTSTAPTAAASKACSTASTPSSSSPIRPPRSCPAMAASSTRKPSPSTVT